MSKKLRMYPDVPRIGQSFKNVKKATIPNQSMTLKQIIARFIKKEALPVEQDGIYHESEYDLEKLAKEDRTVQDEVLEEVKKDVKIKKAKVEKLTQSDPQKPPIDTPPPLRYVTGSRGSGDVHLTSLESAPTAHTLWYFVFKSLAKAWDFFYLFI